MRKAGGARTAAALPSASRSGRFEIAGQSMPCCVLEDARPLIASEAVARALGRPGGSAEAQKGGRFGGRPDHDLADFLRQSLIAPFVQDPLLDASSPVPYRAADGSSAIGYTPEVVLHLAQAYLDCSDYHTERDRNLPIRYQNVARTADLVVRGLATSQTTLADLVEAAAGFAGALDEQMRFKLWEVCLRDGPRPHRDVFPASFYEQICRLRGWAWTPGQNRRPRQIASITNEVVYRRLGEGFLDELRRRNPMDPKERRRRACHHQFVDDEVGLPVLIDHINLVIDLLRRSESWTGFENELNRLCPLGGEIMACSVRAAKAGTSLPLRWDTDHERSAGSARPGGTASEPLSRRF